MTPSSGPDEELRDYLTKLPELPGIRPLDQLASVATNQPRRASYHGRQPPGATTVALPDVGIVSLVREGPLLRWRIGATQVGSTRRAGRAALPPGQVVRQFAYERLETSKVYDFLISMDRTLTPNAAYTGNNSNGLRRWRAEKFEPFQNTAEAAGKNVLLFIHGTFSKSESLLSEGIVKATGGPQFLKAAEGKYDFVLAFDHPTLSVSPMLNAFDLAALLRPSPKSIDIVCHSRGGLVARWFCEGFSDPALKKRAVLVGSPLAGTSLAAPARIRSVLDMLGNVADVLRHGADLFSANPLFLFASGMLRVFSTVTNFAAKTPLTDAAMALVPGLDAQSMQGNNEEVRRLRANTGNSDFNQGQIRYFAIKSNFEPKSPGWNFLQYFSKPLQRIANFGADIIFEGENDLVVDTQSMWEVADGRQIMVAHDFKKSDTVHHLNYFQQSDTVQAIQKTFFNP